MENAKDCARPEWTALLKLGRGEHRVFAANQANVRIALDNDPDLRDRVVYDSFNHQVMRKDRLPWRQDVGAWEDWDTLKLTERLQLIGMDVRPNVVDEGVKIAAFDTQVHPLQEFLAGLVWDGEARVGTLFPRYFGAEDNAYYRAVGKRFLISLVARAMTPGSKVDTMPVLEGAQGLGKSTSLRVLIGDDWFTDQLPNLASKEALIQLRGKWLIEVSELSAMNRSEINEFKAFLTQRVDRYRPLYGRDAQEFPRYCGFAGTTNSTEYLKDATGGRRFWPVQCEKIDLEALKQDRLQLWAEAVVLFHSGEQWHLTAEEEALALVEQGARYVDDPWAPLIDRLVWPRDRVTAAEVLQCMDIPVSQIDQRARTRIGDHLRRWGWKSGKSGSQRYFLRPDEVPEEKRQFLTASYTAITTTFPTVFASSNDAEPLTRTG